MLREGQGLDKNSWGAALSMGALWGIFECTVGYLLHLLPVSLGFLVWYPAAYFFLTKAARDSGKPYGAMAAAGLASAVKLLNLMLPGRVDQVINPAVSILLEGLAVWAAMAVLHRLSAAQQQRRGTMAALVFGANCLWRLLFVGYLALLVPAWMRDISVLRSAEALLKFLLIDNLAGSAVAFISLQAVRRIRLPALRIPAKAAVFLLPLHITLQFLLK